MSTSGQPAQDEILRIIQGWSAGGGPLHTRLAESVAAAIRKGDLPAGTRLPPERQLARALALSRSTVVKALDALRSEGLLESRQGSGTWVPESAVPGAARALAHALEAPRRTTVFNGWIEEQRDTIEFLGACAPALDGLRDELEALRGDLPPLLSQAGYVPLGVPPLRKAIARVLTRGGLPSSPEQILVTSGAQQAIALVAALTLERGSTVILENPTYLSAIDIFTARGARLVPVAVGEDGASFGAVRDAVRATSPGLVYLMPSFHNPMGVVMPAGTRRDLARLADELQVPILEDSSLEEIAFEGSPPPAIAAYSKGGPILTAGSMSKLFWGGLRIGWIRGPEPIILRLARLKIIGDLGSALPSQILATRLLERVDEVRLERRRDANARLQLLTQLLQREIPAWSFRRPPGGLSLWVKLPRGHADEYAQRALRNGVAIVPGPLASPDGSFGDHIRLPFVLDPEPMKRGVERLAEAWRAYAPEPIASREAMPVLV